MPKRRLFSDSEDEPHQKVRKVDNQQTEHHANLEETVSSFRRFSVSQLLDEAQPRMQPPMSEEARWFSIDDLTTYDESLNKSETDTDSEPVEESDDEPEIDYNDEDADDGPASEALQEAKAEIEDLYDLIYRNTCEIIDLKNSNWSLVEDNLGLENEVKALKAVLEAINKEPSQT
ncbi:hypothetical protein Forpe1208_v005221 [Fusarium oxysporum f. sp. rapae]|uniref:Uncharacterized protein n=1 Tax=Fusarium oxysporum f. sp. rapae TaxID=485398 RepID=A0A8J5PCH9_FUSOX|nr:hypothetical protein Forpe1208_v005221 [Fusarium oxysporum f. sp. rapae]